jgi:GT2 family glycosyltransferase
LSENNLASIIILNYNGGNTIIDCIDSIFNFTKNNFELILIDNNSKDKSHLECKKKHDEIILIENNENLGLAARNIGIKKAKGKYIILLDSDTIVEKEWISKFLESYNDHGEGLFQPKLIDANDHTIINSAGNLINLFGQAFSRGKGQKDTGQFNDFQKISYTSGACTFTSKLTAEKIGKIDPLFFAYHDDVDFGWRGQLLGISSYYEPKITILHKGSPTLKWSKEKFFLLERNRWICLLSLYSRKTFVKILPILIIVEIGTSIYFIKKKMIFSKIKALSSLIQQRKEIEKKRKLIKKTRINSDSKIIRNFVDEFDTSPIIINQKSKTRINSIISSLSKTARKLINE